jgi:lipoprotein NlpD
VGRLSRGFSVKKKGDVKMKKLALYLYLSFNLAMLSGCAMMEPVNQPGYYAVQHGDTLSKIAATYNLDYQTLARQNNLQYPYILKVGEVLYVGHGPKHHHAASTVGQGLPARTQINNVSKTTVQSVASPSALQGQTLDLSQYGSAAPKVAPTAAVVESAVPVQSGGHATVDGLKVNTTNTQLSDGVTWAWPVTGSVIEAFGEGNGLLARGMQISIPINSQVLAAANGQVIFSGEGAEGYGKMIIIKHDNNFLTAYTDLSSILVTQGQKITQGQAIALSGRINNAPLVHFEVRKFGSPVNPLLYLPAPSALKPVGPMKPISAPKIDSAN